MDKKLEGCKACSSYIPETRQCKKLVRDKPFGAIRMRIQVSIAIPGLGCIEFHHKSKKVPTGV